MLSSTSNSRPSFRQELRVLAVVALVLLISEIGLRIVEARSSHEYRSIAALPHIAEKFATDSSLPSVLIIGNSLANDGLNPDIFMHEIKATLQTKPVFDLVALPGSEMCQWYWLFKAHFIDTGRHPDIVVISAATFSDSPRITISRLAALTHRGCYADLMNSDLPAFEERAAFVHSLVFRSFAGRDRIQKSVLNAIVPHYQDGRIWQQSMLRQGLETPQPNPTTTAPAQSAYTRLTRFLNLADEHNIQVVLLLMPLADHYNLDAELIDIIARRNVTVIDCRSTQDITPESYYDGVHLNPDAAIVFTRHLAHRFSNEILNNKTGPANNADIIGVTSEAN